MRTALPRTRLAECYSLRETAWMLGIDTSKVSRAIRTGALPTVRRRSRLMVPARAIARWLDAPAGTSPTTTIGRNRGGDAP